jgi:SAM-dependent methyltransferase
MSSWVSHLPDEVAYGEVVGQGMNAEELAANPRLDRWLIQDFNRNPVLPLAEASVDAAMICVGVQYLQHPVAVMQDIARTLRPDAPLVISFSNRCFPTKAVAVWLTSDPQSHARLIDLYLRAAGFTSIETHALRDGRQSDPITVVLGRKGRAG